MSFDIDGARQAGYSDAEIADHLAKSSGFDAAGARKAGYSDGEIIGHLSRAESKQPTKETKQKSFGQRAIEFVEPTVQALGAAGGGILGAPLGPIGLVGGAGLGYGIAKGGTDLLKEALGYQEPPKNALDAVTRGAKDVLTGATYEAGGQAVAPYLAKGAGWAADFAQRRLGPVRAGTIAREVVGPDLATIKEALRNADDSVTAAQATANINSPTWQALVQRAQMRDPRSLGSGPLTPQQSMAAANQLAGIAGGNTQTGMRSARESAVDAHNKRLIPTLDVELNAANTAGLLKPKLEGEASRFGNAAASKVEDVRRFTRAGARAAERAANTTLVPGYPMVPGRYTYMGELEKKAEQVAAKAADASLPFGEASRFAQSAADSLAAHGLKPLDSAPIVYAIKSTAANPKFAGNKDIEKSLYRVAEDIVHWTNQGGVIDAYALDAIRKNSVNGVIRELYPSADKSAQKELAAGILAKIKPVVVDAIEGAGGTGYGKYLADYSSGRRAIDQMKLGAEALSLFKSNPKQFVSLVEGNSPKEVERIFGPGNYDIAKEMSAEAMGKLGAISDVTKRGLEAGRQATEGQNALREILESHNPRFVKIPWGLSPKTMALNRALDVAEKRIGRSTMNALTQGVKSGKNALDVLETLPSKDKFRVLQALQDPSLFPGVTAGTVNALTLQD